MITRLKVWLLFFGIVVAAVLDMVGRQQGPSVLQDSPPFVPPAIVLCESINAPTTLWLGVVALLAHSVHFEQSFSRIPMQVLFYGGVALLWFVVGLEVELRLTKRLSARHRVVAASMGITVAVALASFGVAAWRQDQAVLTMGCAVWSAVITLFYCTDLTSLAASYVQAR